MQALTPASPRLPPCREGVVREPVLRSIVLAREPAALAQELLEACKEVLGGVEGLALLSLRPQTRLQAVSGLQLAQGEQLLAALGGAPAQLVTESLQAAAVSERLRAELAALGGQVLLRLPLNNAAAEPVGCALLLLSHPIRLAPALTRALGVQSEWAAAALSIICERQELLEQNEQLVEDLAALRGRLAAAQEELASSEAVTHALQQQLEQRRGRDVLTGLISGRHFHSRLEIEVQRARRYRDELGLLLIDIDEFRHFNQNHGRTGGDKALARLGAILRQELRMVDHAFRYGGEEFTVILPRCGAEALLQLAERLRQRVAAETFQIDGQPAQLTISLGAAVHRQGVLVESFIRSVDDALYQAKIQGRNRVVLASAAPQ